MRMTLEEQLRAKDNSIKLLQDKLEKSFNEAKKYYQQVLNRQDQIVELQQRAESAIKRLENITPCNRTYNSEKAIRILKGEHDD